MSKQAVTIFWFRRDLRLHDNKGLYYALKSAGPVLPVFIFDDDILDPLPGDDHRVTFFYGLLKEMDRQLRKAGSGLLVKRGRPLQVFAEILEQYQVGSVFCNGDHEPYGQERDQQVRQLLDDKGIPMHASIDHLIMEKNEVLKADGSPYLVFTPYSKQWKKQLTGKHLNHFESEAMTDRFFQGSVPAFPSLKKLGFSPSKMPMPEADTSEGLISNYDRTRDFPGAEGTSRVGPHLRFGSISIRELVKKARQWNETYLNELIWREFYAMILWQFPRVVKEAFKPGYDRIAWRNDDAEFERWKNGTTGYPMVDAGMRQLAATGFMHNRLRMVTASFLTKHLLTDWRWGEAWFAEKLFDFELSSNNGGWQWSAGTGTDAAPYFRIFNPMEQQKKFDPDMKFIKKWIPELETSEYPEPMVDHKMARQRCLDAYREAIG
jgi:deoxyribodipyrimidine photo-lyase